MTEIQKNKKYNPYIIAYIGAGVTWVFCSNLFRLNDQGDNSIGQLISLVLTVFVWIKLKKHYSKDLHTGDK